MQIVQNGLVIPFDPIVFRLWSSKFSINVVRGKPNGN